MLRAALTDIHGNLEALEAVLADLDVRQPAEVVCLGDFVGYGGAPNECVDRVRPRLAAAVAGNHDVAACGRLLLGGFSSNAAQAARWTESVLSPGNRAWLESLPLEVTLPGARLVHASPAEPDAWHYVLSVAEARLEFDAFAERLCLIGHSHYPGAFRLGPRPDDLGYTREPEVRLEPGCRFLVNVPSVGQPRDGDPRAGYLLWDDDGDDGWVRHVRIEYDVAAARQRILDAGLPRFLGDRLQWGE